MQQDNRLLDRVAQLLVQVAKVDPAQITRDSRLRDGFGIDSLSMIDLVVTAEDAFDVRIPDEDAERFETVGDIVDFLQRADVAT
jgi:acyl carrier protein